MMKQIMLEKRRKLKEGEILPLYFDETFKIMFANPEHLEILTVLVSKILKVDYQEIEGKVELMPSTIPNRQAGEIKSERDVVVMVKTDPKYQLVLEVNIKPKFYQSVIDRNLHYLNEVSSSGLEEGKNYEDMRISYLVNFNTFFINKERKKAIDIYLYRNEEGDLLTKRSKIINVNIEECYKMWYNQEYEGKFGIFEEDLLLLGASLLIQEEGEFEKCLERIRMKPEIKKLMEEVAKEMAEDERMWGRVYNREEEDKLIWDSIRAEERKMAKEEVREEVKNEVREEVKSEVRKEIKKEIQKEVKEKVTKELQQEMRKEQKAERKLIFQNLIDSGMNISEIAKILKIDEAEIRKTIK